MQASHKSAQPSDQSGVRRFPSWPRTARYLIYMMPAAAVYWFISRYGVNLPYMDDWIMPGALRQASTLRGFFSQLFYADTDHAILIPRLVFVPLAHLTHWNVKVGMFTVLLSSIIAFLSLIRLAESDGQSSGAWRVPVALFVSALLMFSFVHYDTWLHDWQLTHDMGNMFAVLAIAFITLSRSTPMTRVATAWAFCFAASMCYLGGLVAWFAIIPSAILIFPDRRHRLFVCAASGVFSVLNWLFIRFAFVLYPTPTNWLFWLEHPLLGLEYFTALIGAPLGQAGFLAPVVLALISGVILILLGLWSVGFIFREPELYRSAAAWLGIGLFGLGVSLMNTIGRGSYTAPIAASTSRYMIDSVFVAVAVLHLSRVTLRSLEFITVAALFGVLSVLGSAASLKPARHIRRDRLRAAACLVAEPYLSTRADDYELGTLYPTCPLPGCVTRFRINYNVAALLGLHGMSNHLPFVDDPNLPYGEFVSPATDGKPLDLNDQKMVRASGWAAIPGGAASTCVLITDGRIGILATSVPQNKNSRPMMPSAGDSSDPEYKWSLAIPARFLDPGKSVLEAWVYDPAGRRFVRLMDLGGAKQLSK